MLGGCGSVSLRYLGENCVLLSGEGETSVAMRRQCFDFIRALVEKLVEVDEAIVARENLEFARSNGISGVGEPLGSDPIVDVAEHVGFSAISDSGLVGDGGSHDGGNGGKVVNDRLETLILATITISVGLRVGVPSSGETLTGGNGSHSDFIV
ncbi:hypothetical protein VNO80_15692 [Phaseolus coccineus]|uniref:Uncharacterized protein n=1 Tax=Phaseolus coccineus TaxID=3886 RepID=A0AAN9R2I6_PHACN